MFGRIIGTGSYIPERKLKNDDLKQWLETDDAWIQERTGIAARHVMAIEETTKDMAVHAAKKALEASKLAPEQIDLIIVSTVSSDISLPNTACYVQQQLQAENAMCFDLNAACTGFMMAYNTAQAYINTGMIQTALLVGAEGLSRIVDWQDRGTCILFGDGAGAAVLQASNEAVFKTVMHSDGTGGDALACTNSFALRPRLIDGEEKNIEEKATASRSTEEKITECKTTESIAVKANETHPDPTYVSMDGQQVFRFAIRQVPKVITELLQETKMEKEDVDWYLLHQANRRIIESVAKRLKISMEKVPVDLQEYGNTSSASIPILLDEMVRSGKLNRGQKVVLSGFGAGLTWAATYLEY